MRRAWTPEKGHYQTVPERGIRGASVAPHLRPQRPRCPRTSSPRPTPRPTCWCAGSHRLSATGTSPTTWCCGSVWRRTATSTSTTTATAVRRAAAQAGGSGRRRRGAVRLTAPLPRAAPGLRLPTSHSDPRFDREDEEPEAETEPGCCPCQHPPPGQVLPPLEAQEASFQKKFENFLHNAITIPKCVPSRGRGRGGPGGRGRGRAGGRGRGGAGAGPDAALPGLPRSPWKVTSIHKNPQR